jgi:hypothetical protein
LTLTAAPLAPVSVQYATGDHTAIAGSDYTAHSGTLTLLTGTTSATFSVPIINDNLDEPNESLTLTLSSPAGAALGAPNPARLTIQDDDLAPEVILTPTSGLTTTEAGNSATFIVALNTPPTATVTLTLTSSDPTEGSLAPAVLHFTPLNWNQPKIVTVTGVEDTEDDGDIAYTVIISAAVSPDPRYNGLDPADVAVVNLDNEEDTYLPQILKGA